MTRRRFTFAEKAECAEREVRQRIAVYARKQGGGALTDWQRQQIAMMAEIAADYRDAAKRAATTAEADLFEGEERAVRGNRD